MYVYVKIGKFYERSKVREDDAKLRESLAPSSCRRRKVIDTARLLHGNSQRTNSL